MIDFNCGENSSKKELGTGYDSVTSSPLRESHSKV
jgi:hypothetical protein